jgi:hypothetical protein
MSETGSTTGWGVGSSIPSVSTIQSSETGETVLARKEAVSAGNLDGIVDFSVSEEPNFLMGLFQAPVSTFKNSVPGGGLLRAMRSLSGEYSSVWVSFGLQY